MTKKLEEKIITKELHAKAMAWMQKERLRGVEQVPDAWLVEEAADILFELNQCYNGAMSIFLKDVKFAVQPAGREKVRREGKKNVHAFIRGTYLAPSTFPHTTSEFKAKCTEWVTYNPYQNDHFTATVTDPETTFTSYQDVHEAKLVTLTYGYVYATL